MTFSEYLSRSGETVDAFAERSGVSRSTLFRVKKGGARNAGVIEKIVAATGGKVTANDLVVGIAPKGRRKVA